MTPKPFRHWLPGEDRFILETLRRHTLTTQEMAVALQRRPGSVQRRASYLTQRRRMFRRFTRLAVVK